MIGNESRWISSNSAANTIIQRARQFLPVVSSSSSSISRNPRFYNVSLQNAYSNKISRISPAMRKDAQEALLDYLHVNRGFEYTVAETMSRNSPQFLGELIRKINPEGGDIALSITRFVCYHPINEFEPFFESLGLKPAEYSQLLPRKLMYLTDDELLLENYRVLCSYGIERCKIGAIYREATEVFRYGNGVLCSKLMGYEQLGLSSSSVAKTVACFPRLLVGDVNVDFVNVVEMLKSMGIKFTWIEEQLSRRSSCNWKQSFLLLNSLQRSSFIEQDELRELVIDHPEIVFEGEHSLLLIGFLLKMGCSSEKIVSSIFRSFPRIQVTKFISNLRQCIRMLDEIHMEPHEIKQIVESHSLLMGSHTLKKTKTLLYRLNIGKKKLLEIVRSNPNQMKNWVIGCRVTPLQSPGGKQKSHESKSRFLLNLGYTANSAEMAKAMKVFRGKGPELQERFDALVNAGLSREDVIGMVAVSPHLLNQSREVTETKIEFLVNELGYDVSCLIKFPSLLNFRVERIKLRLRMYDWLIGEGVVSSNLSLSNLISSSDSVFFGRYVELHCRGP
ncbi:Transcription termination factor MTEF18, mitochondrial, partial [Linum perenne]